VTRQSNSAEIKNHVRERARYLCEYCHTSEKWQYVPFTIDHITPLAKGGSDELDNLALACFHCNRYKSDRVTAINSKTGTEIPLFNPRHDNWNDHFIWSIDGLRIVPITAIGRVTIELLRLNRERIIPIRADDILVNRHPPSSDKIKKFA